MILTDKVHFCRSCELSLQIFSRQSAPWMVYTGWSVDCLQIFDRQSTFLRHYRRLSAIFKQTIDTWAAWMGEPAVRRPFSRRPPERRWLSRRAALCEAASLRRSQVSAGNKKRQKRSCSRSRDHEEEQKWPVSFPSVTICPDRADYLPRNSPAVSYGLCKYFAASTQNRHSTALQLSRQKADYLDGLYLLLRWVELRFMNLFSK
jgi:hypothetical protein